MFAAWFCLTLIWGHVAGFLSGSLGQVNFLDQQVTFKAYLLNRVRVPGSHPLRKHKLRRARSGPGQAKYESWSQFNKTFTSVAIVSESENNSYTCKLHLLKLYWTKDKLEFIFFFEPCCWRFIFIWLIECQC